MTVVQEYLLGIYYSKSVILAIPLQAALVRNPQARFNSGSGVEQEDD